MQIPAFLLKQMYRQGSLANHAEGFRFEVHNHMMSATIVGIDAIAVGGELAPLEGLEFSALGEVRGGHAISEQAPVPFAKGVTVSVSVRGEPLAEGTHHLTFKVRTGEFGPIHLDVTDTL
ncbi:hypothetical protein J7643_01050 [bacterium]|nr:hypothetical protein [bacterium]